VSVLYWRVQRDRALERGDMDAARLADRGAEMAERPPEEWELWRVSLRDWCGMQCDGGSERRRCVCQGPYECRALASGIWPSTGGPTFAINYELGLALGSRP
jgi:hypothetical protein